MNGQEQRILFLSHNLPYPPHAGVTHRTYNALRELASEFLVDVLAFHRKAYHPGADSVAAAVDALSHHGRVRAVPLACSYSRIELVKGHISSILNGRVYTLSQYASADYRSALDRLLRSEPYDVVHIDSIVLAGYAKALDRYPIVCVHHNAESDLLWRASRLERNPLKSGYLSLQARRMAALEQECCPAFAANVVVSALDREKLAALAPEARFEVIENGVDCHFFRPGKSEDDTRRVVFVGGLSWPPNWDGVLFFLREIWPLLRARVPALSLDLVGSCTDRQRRLLKKHPGVNVLGRVDDIRPYVRRAGCAVVPLRVGGGTRIKILDAWAMGKAVVSTALGCEGLRYADEGNILVRDTARDFADAVTRVLENRRLRQDLGDTARRTAMEHYSWSSLGRRMRELYHEVGQMGRRARFVCGA